MFSYFTISSANSALPDIIKKFEYVLKCKDEVMKTEQQLQFVLSASNKFAEYIPLKQLLNNKVTKYYQAIESLEQTGVVIKSIDEGLLDFPAKRFDEEVWLCWKYGESEIKFWHEKDVGFMGRKPIEINDESLV